MPPLSQKRKRFVEKSHLAIEGRKAKRAQLMEMAPRPSINVPEVEIGSAEGEGDPNQLNMLEAENLTDASPPSPSDPPLLPSNPANVADDAPTQHEVPAEDLETTHNRPPTPKQARDALNKIDAATRTPRRSGGFIYADLDYQTRRRFEAMEACLNHFTAAGSKGFLAASLTAAIGQGRSAHHAQLIRKWIRTLVDTGDLPYSQYGWWNVSILEDEDVSRKIKKHLQTIGKYARAEDVVEFLADPATRTKLGIPQTISLRTAQRWMRRCGGFCWRSEPKGQYFDGHERVDVVEYRQLVYLPFWKELERLRTIYNEHGEPDLTRPMALQPGEKPVIIWFHDESIFFANDRRLVRWVCEDEHAVPFKKGNGNTLMVGDFVCAEFGWLRGNNGQTARVVFRPGSNRDGYFTCNQVVKQLENAIKIVKETYPEYTHMFVYDNAPSHTKRPEDAISARYMPKKPTEVFPRPYETKVGKKVVPPRMEPGKLPDGSSQSFYFPDDHPKHPGWFKGMAEILKERGMEEIAKKLAQCPDFKCEAGKTDCCCRRALFCQPDFESRDSSIEEVAQKLGSRVVFLPKYHCELNPIEQCWGYAKKKYRDMPPANKDSVMRTYVLEAVDSVPLISIRKYAARTQRFIDAYMNDNSGPEAIEWATKKFRSHRQTPSHLSFHQI